MEKEVPADPSECDKEEPRPFPWIPRTLSAKLYAARDFEQAANFEPTLNKLLMMGFEEGGQAEVDRRVKHYNDELDKEIARREAERRRRLRNEAIGLAAKTGSGIAATIGASLFGGGNGSQH